MAFDFIIEFEISEPKLVSVNDQYMHPVRKTKSGRYTSYVCKSPSLKELQSFYKEVLSDKILDEDLKRYKEFLSEVPRSGIQLSLEIGLPEREIYEHDASNFVKALEDSISVRTSIDDSRNLRVIVEKQYTEDSSWMLKVRLCPYIVQKYRPLAGRILCEEKNSEDG